MATRKTALLPEVLRPDMRLKAGSRGGEGWVAWLVITAGVLLGLLAFVS